MGGVNDIVADAWREGWLLPDRRPIYEWAAEHVILPNAFTLNGPFDVSVSRFLVGPFDSLTDDHVRQVTLVAPVRSGKTLVADVWLPWIVVNDPGPTMVNLQTDKIASQHAESRTMRILETCRPVSRLFSPDRHKKRSSEVIFSNGMPVYIQGPSLSNLQAKGIRYQVNDEIWHWRQGVLAHAKARLGDFEEQQTSKILNISQAGSEDDDLDSEFKRGDRCEWHVECQKCGHFMMTRWRGDREDGTRWGMVWDEIRTASGDWDVAKVMPTIRYECEKCAHPHIYSAQIKHAWNRTGKYVPQNPDAPRSIKSFHYSGIITRAWPALVEEYLGAMNARRRGVIDPLIAFLQKRIAEPASENSLIQEETQVRRIEYDINASWKAEKVRFLTVDRQSEDLYWVMARAWSESGESRRLWFGRLYSPADIEAKREELKIQRNHVLIDSGYQAKGDQGVYASCIRYGWIALKGEDDYWFWHFVKRGQHKQRVRRSYAPLSHGDPGIGTSRQGQKYCRLIRFSSPNMKDRMTRLIRLGKWVDPKVDDDMDREYRRQMSAEFKKRKVDAFTGKETMVWVCPSRNNHAFDCGAEQVLAATLYKIIPDVESEPGDEEQ